jgi:hypothetical protein
MLAVQIKTLNRVLLEGVEAGAIPAGVFVTRAVDPPERGTFVINDEPLKDEHDFQALKRYVAHHIPGCTVRIERTSEWKTLVIFPPQAPRPFYLRRKKNPSLINTTRSLVYDAVRDSPFASFVLIVLWLMIMAMAAKLMVHWSGYSEPWSQLFDSSYATMLIRETLRRRLETFAA